MLQHFGWQSVDLIVAEVKVVERTLVDASALDGLHVPHKVVLEVQHFQLRPVFTQHVAVQSGDFIGGQIQVFQPQESAVGGHDAQISHTAQLIRGQVEVSQTWQMTKFIWWH